MSQNLNNYKRLSELIEKWAEGFLTDKEQVEFDNWCKGHPSYFSKMNSNYGVIKYDVRTQVWGRIKKAIGI